MSLWVDAASDSAQEQDKGGDAQPNQPSRNVAALDRVLERISLVDRHSMGDAIARVEHQASGQPRCEPVEKRASRTVRGPITPCSMVASGRTGTEPLASRRKRQGR